MIASGSTTFSSHKADGAAGERYAAAILTCALCAQAANSTLQEDGKKLDLKISLLNAFSAHKSIVSVHAQIKHGNSYARQSPGRITLQNLGNETVPTLQDGTQPALIIWVPPWPNREIYWHIIRPKGKHRSPIKIAEGDIVTPGLRFELSRFANFERRNPRYPSLDIRQITGEPTSRANAKMNYAKLKKESLSNPLLGNILVTRLAWRHITRFSRTTDRRLRSFHILEYLRVFLEKVPTRYLVDRKPSCEKDGLMLERSEIVFWYANAFHMGQEAQTLLIRFIEEVEYPQNWRERPLSEKDVTHKVTLMSWWFKPQKSGASLFHTDDRITRQQATVGSSVTLP
ncbi:hypothetical protein [Luteolibacter sp. LG18]|uniref:hypothetical protein n=1 Tax=Luteolibacter sp. LG18 TaxID=2819286 RepID=UPI002B294108|nr:hypothetical protein llg_09880 [Luteolibacter sp. LG18]